MLNVCCWWKAVIRDSFAVATASCYSSRPPQTGSYCVDITEGRSADADRFVRTAAARLDFKVSEAEFESLRGPPGHNWEVYGRGVSMFVSFAMKDGPPDRFGNVRTTFNPNRLDFLVAKTGWRQSIAFVDVVATARKVALELGWRVTAAPAGKGRAT